jgi:protocatechuate 3,4-dioxygenase beta subunit
MGIRNPPGDRRSRKSSSSGIVRSDIRSSFGSSTTTAPGVPLALTITLVNSNMACAPLQGYAIYIWHCNRDGNYSLYSSAVQNENYLRGVQVTDANGQVTFTTIFPACYSGRYPHIHFEIYPSLGAATSYASSVLISQMALPSAICQAVYNNATGYTQSITNCGREHFERQRFRGQHSGAARPTDSRAGRQSRGRIHWYDPHWCRSLNLRPATKAVSTCGCRAMEATGAPWPWSHRWHPSTS